MTVPSTYTLSAVQCIRLAGLAGVMLAVMLTVAASAGAARARPAMTRPVAGMSFESFTVASLPTKGPAVVPRTGQCLLRCSKTSRKLPGGGDVDPTLL